MAVVRNTFSLESILKREKLSKEEEAPILFVAQKGDWRKNNDASFHISVLPKSIPPEMYKNRLPYVKTFVEDILIEKLKRANEYNDTLKNFELLGYNSKDLTEKVEEYTLSKKVKIASLENPLYSVELYLTSNNKKKRNINIIVQIEYYGMWIDQQKEVEAVKKVSILITGHYYIAKEIKASDGKIPKEFLVVNRMVGNKRIKGSENGFKFEKYEIKMDKEDEK